MELEQLRIFCAVAACRSFTRAARQLFVSHSTTSRAVSALERELGVPLLARDRHTVALTPAGQIYVQSARRFLQIEAQMNESLAALSGRQTGLLRLGLPMQRADELLPQVLADLTSRTTLSHTNSAGHCGQSTMAGISHPSRTIRRGMP